MSRTPKEVVREVFPRMLEDLTFLFADPDDSGSPSGMPHDAVKVSIAFSGDRSGDIEMGLARSLGAEMASSVLGVDPNEAKAGQIGDDALRELMNVTCGHVLTSLAGERPVFNLSIPVVERMDGDAWEALARDSDTAMFNVDGRPVHVRLRFDG